MEFYLYPIAFTCVGVAAGLLYEQSKRSLQRELMAHIMSGKRVVICVDADATILTIVNNKLRVSKAVMEFHTEDEDGNAVDDMRNREFTQPFSELP